MYSVYELLSNYFKTFRYYFANHGRKIVDTDLPGFICAFMQSLVALGYIV